MPVFLQFSLARPSKEGWGKKDGTWSSYVNQFLGSACWEEAYLILSLHHQSHWLLFCLFFLCPVAFMCALHPYLSFAFFACAWSPHALSWYNYICVHKRVCVSVFFACLGFYITKSLLKNEGNVCIHAWAYSKCTETFHLPQRPACLQACALPFLPLLST